MRYVLASILVFLTTLLIMNDDVHAHPHAWIDLESTLIFNESEQIIALRHRWLFGDFYSSYVLNDIQASEADIRDELRETARGNLVALEEYDYYTRFIVDGTPSTFERVESFETGVIDGRIYLEFTVFLTSPVSPASHTIRYAIFDPTYYIEILHTEGSTPAIDDAANTGCYTKLTPSEPTFDKLAYAASLDVTESGGNGLGELFAEWVTLTCP